MRKRGRGSIHCSGEVGVGLLIARDVTFLTKRARGVYIYIAQLPSGGSRILEWVVPPKAAHSAKRRIQGGVGACPPRKL